MRDSSRRAGAGSVVVRHSNSNTLVAQCPLVAVGSPHLTSAGRSPALYCLLDLFRGFQENQKAWFVGSALESYLIAGVLFS